MNEELAGKLVYLLKNLNEVPDFNDADLFTEEIYKLTKFQIRCQLNSSNRTIFSLSCSGSRIHTGDKEAFQTLYCRINGGDAYLGRDNLRPDKYPKFGNDYIDDLSPENIVKMLQVTFIEKGDEDDIFPLFFMYLSNKIEGWSNFFIEKAKKINYLKEVADDIYDISL